jgi:membrane dipeptidase
MVSVRVAAAVLALGAAGMIDGNVSGQGPAGSALRERALRLHRTAIVIDTHSDTTSRTLDRGFDIGKRAADGHMDVPRMREGGLAAQFFAVYVAGEYAPDKAAHRAMEMIDTVRHDIVGRYPNDFVLATSVDDIRRAKASGKIAALMGIEGGHAIEDSLRLLRQFHALGIRYMTLTHNNTNNWADSSRDVAKHNGLTNFGREVVAEMNRLGMMIDVSHVADKTMLDAVAASKAPIIASHSSVSAFANVPRNMKDELIRALAKNRGVMMINFNCGFISQRYADESAKRDKDHADEIKQIQERFKDDDDAATAEINRRWPIKRPTLGDVADHFDHVKKLIGNVDNLGLGSDFDGVPCVPEGLDDVTHLPDLTAELMRRGYTDEELKKILGENLLRAFSEVEKVAKASAK